MGIIEATDFEKFCLWERWNPRMDIEWKDESLGYFANLGKVADMPVCLSLWIAYINGKKVLFWDATSQVVDYRMIEAWFEKHLKDVKKTDANNAHIVLHMTMEKEIA